MQEIKDIHDMLMPEEQFIEAEFRFAVLGATEKICENILAKTSDVDLTYQEFWVAIQELAKATNYYQEMCKVFASGDSEPTLDYEFLLNVLMLGDMNLTRDSDTIRIAVSLALYGMYNRFYSAAIMLIGIANQKFPERAKSIKAMYKKLSPDFSMPKFTTSTPQTQAQTPAIMEASKESEALNAIK